MESLTTIDSLVLAEAANVDVAVNDTDLLIDSDYEGSLQQPIEAAINAKWQGVLGSGVEIVVSSFVMYIVVRR